MSVEHLAVVLHHSRAKGTAKLVLLGIANHAGDGGAWPSVATLARYASVDPRNVQKAITSLVGLGEITVAIQAGGTPEWDDHRRPNRYTIMVECPPWCDRTTQHRDTRPSAQGTPPLWITGVTGASPGDGSVTPPLSESSPHGVTEASPKPSNEPSTNSVPAVEAKPLDTRACSECGHPQARCITMQQKLASDDTHPYTPKPSKPRYKPTRYESLEPTDAEG